MTKEAQPSAGSPYGRLLRHTLIYGSGYVTVAISSFVLVPFYTRHLTPADYGLLGLMLVLYGLMSQLYDFGFTNSVGRFYFDRTDEDPEAALRDMQVTALVFLATLGIVLTAILIGWSPQWSSLLTQSRSHAQLVAIVALTMLAEGVAIVPLTMIRMRERSRAFVLISLTRFVVTLTLSILFVVGFGWGVAGALFANTLSALAVLVILMPDLWRLRGARFSRTLCREMVRFGLPFFPVLLSSWFIEASDRYLLGLYRSKAEVGFYVLGYKVAQVMQIGVAAFSMGWAPIRYRIFERPDAQDVYRGLTNWYAVVAGTVTVGICLIAREGVSLIAPPAYASAARIVPLITLGYALNGLYLLVVTGMGVAKRTAPMAWVVGLAAALNVGINIVAIPIWGMEAAAVTTVLANVIMVAGGWWYSEKVYPIRYDWSRIGRVLAAGAVVVVAADEFAPGGGGMAFATTGAGLVAFLVLLVATGVIPVTSVRRALRGWRVPLRLIEGITHREAAS